MSFKTLKKDLTTWVNRLEKEITEAGDEVNPSAWSQVWIHYRAAVISILMADGDKKQFFQRLVSSASARKNYLTLVQSGQLKASHYCRASELNPYFDALIAGEFSLAA